MAKPYMLFTQHGLEMLLAVEKDRKAIKQINEVLEIFELADDISRRTGAEFVNRDGTAQDLAQEISMYAKDEEYTLATDKARDFYKNLGDAFINLYESTKTVAKGTLLLIRDEIIKNKRNLD